MHWEGEVTVGRAIHWITPLLGNWGFDWVGEPGEECGTLQEGCGDSQEDTEEIEETNQVS